jgi:hypothetical protein
MKAVNPNLQHLLGFLDRRFRGNDTAGIIRTKSAFVLIYSPPPSPPPARRGVVTAAWTGTVRIYEMIASI